MIFDKFIKIITNKEFTKINYEIDKKMFYEIYLKIDIKRMVSMIRLVLAYLNVNSSHKSHRVIKFLGIFRNPPFSEEEIIREVRENKDFNLVLRSVDLDLKKLGLDENGGKALVYSLILLVEALFFNIKNSKNSFLFEKCLILNKNSIYKNSITYFSLILSLLVEDKHDFILEKSTKSFKNKGGFIEKLSGELLFDIILIFEANFAQKKNFNYKKIAYKEISALDSIIDMFNDLKKALNSSYTTDKDGSSSQKSSRHDMSYILKILPDSNVQKSLEKKSRDVDPYFIEHLWEIILVIKSLVLNWNNSAVRSSIRDLLLHLDLYKQEYIDSPNKEIEKLLSKILFLHKSNDSTIPNGNLIAIVFFTKLYIKIYELLLSKVSIFREHLVLLKKPYSLHNLDVEAELFVLKDDLWRDFKNDAKWDRTMVLSANPIIVFDLADHNHLSTNLLPNNTLPLYSNKDNKFSIVDKSDSSHLNTIKKLNMTGFTPDIGYLTLVQSELKTLDNLPIKNEDGAELEIFSGSLEKEIFNKFIFLMETYNLSVFYFIWYLDNRNRIYGYSSFGPTSGRVMRGVTTYALPQDQELVEGPFNSSKESEYFKLLEDSCFEKFLDNLWEIPVIKNNYKSYKANRAHFLSYNSKVYLIALANRYFLLRYSAHKELLSYSQILSNFLDCIVDNRFPILEFISIFKDNFSTFDALELHKLFKTAILTNSMSRSDTFEELYILHTFKKYLSQESRGYFVQFDVSASALVLSSLILGHKSPENLNITSNLFVKNDPYTLISFKFADQLTFLSESERSEVTQILNRSVFKKPAMTIMYGSGEETTVKKLRTHIKLKVAGLKGKLLKQDDLSRFSTILAFYIYKFLAPISRNTGKDGSLKYDTHINAQKSNISWILANSSGTDIQMLVNDKENFIGEGHNNGNYEKFKIYMGSLEALFYQLSLNFFADEAEKNLLFYAGIIWINGEAVELGYSTKKSRITSSVLEDIPNYLKAKDLIGKGDGFDKSTKRARISVKSNSINIQLKELFLDDNWSIRPWNQAPIYEKAYLNFFRTINKSLNKRGLILSSKAVDQIILHLRDNKYEKFLKLLELKVPKNRQKDVFYTKTWALIIEDFPSYSVKDVQRLHFIILNLVPHLEKFSTAFRANVIHAVDAYIARKMILSIDSPLVTNHDCFYLPYNRITELILNYNKIYQDVEIDINDKVFKSDFKIKDNLPFFL